MIFSGEGQGGGGGGVKGQLEGYGWREKRGREAGFAIWREPREIEENFATLTNILQ